MIEELRHECHTGLRKVGCLTDGSLPSRSETYLGLKAMHSSVDASERRWLR